MGEAHPTIRRMAQLSGLPLALDPGSPRTLSELLVRAAALADDAGLVFVDERGSESVVSYGELLCTARRGAARLRERQVAAGQPVILLMRSDYELVAAFWSAVLAGAVPAPLPSVLASHDAADLASAHRELELNRLRTVWARLARPPIIAPSAHCTLLADWLERHDAQQSPSSGDLGDRFRMWSAGDLCEGTARVQPHSALGQDAAVLLFSSGSTSAPKGIALSHDNLLADLAATCQHNGFGQRDPSLCWAPLYHVIGLTCFHLVPMYALARQVILEPTTLLKRPELWFERIHRYRVSFTGGPNFAFALATSRIADQQVQAWDLSCVRVLLNGGEVAAVRTLEAFYEKFRAAGLRRECLAPAYGMSEAAGGIAYPLPSQPFRAVRVDRRRFAERREVAITEDAASDVVEFAPLGQPLPGLELRIVDEQDRLLHEHEVGEIQIRGPMVADRYYDDPEATAAAHCQDWLRTGDLGFVHAGQLVIVGRTKDVLIVNGHNYYAHDLEQVALGVSGVVPGRAVAVSAFDHEAARERVAIFVSIDHAQPEPVLEEVRRAIQRSSGLAVDRVVHLRPEAFPRTATGKIHRQQLADQFAAGHFDVAPTVRSVAPPPDEVAAGTPPVSRAVEVYLTEQVARSLSIAAADIDREQAFVEVGLDSVAAVTLLRDLEVRLGVELPVTVVFDQPSIAALAAWLCATHPRACAQLSAVDQSPATGVAGAAVPRCSSDAVVHGQPVREARCAVPSDDAGLPETAVAIVGMAARFPAAPTVDDYWQNLCRGISAIREVPRGRWDADRFFSRDPHLAGKSVSKWGGFLDDVEGFDAAHFGIAPHEATRMDPQQRLLLETSWEAFEAAGLAGPRLVGTATGVYVGVSLSDAMQQALRAGTEVDGYLATGNFLSILANRISYVFNLKGPSLAVDTACSSSLVALHLAVNSLNQGECTTALVAGVHLLLVPELWVNFSQAGMLARDGKVKTFDARADGYVRGEGVAAVVLKRLSDAVRDRDAILAVVRGTAVNQDGRSNGLTAPSRAAQVELIEAAYRAARLSPRDVSYQEAHGTGTRLGDPIELAALSDAFRAAGSRPQKCALGSVKPNIGHLEPAAGMAGLVKTVLALKYRQLPPTLHLEVPNPHADLEKLPFYVVDRLRAWPSGGGPRRAAVTALGFGGTNAHVVLEESPVAGSRAVQDEAPAGSEAACHLLALSARTRSSLVRLVRRYARHLSKSPHLDAADVCYTAATGRAHWPLRVAVVGRNCQELVAGLEAWLRNDATQALTPTPPSQSTFASMPATTPTHVESWEPRSRAYCEALASAYLAGESIQWERIYAVDSVDQGTSPRGPTPPRRVPLPTYPFQHERYPLPGAPATDEWLRVVDWYELPAPHATRLPQGTWLVVDATAGEAHDIARTVASRLRSAGCRVIEAVSGEQIADAVVSNPVSTPEGVIYVAGDELSAQTSNEPALPGLVRLVRTVQTLERLRDRPLEFWCVTRGAVTIESQTFVTPDCSARDDVEPEPTQAALWGLGHGIAREYPAWRVHVRDLSLRVTSPEAAAECLWSELCESVAIAEVALRGQRRLAPRIVAGASLPPTARAVAIRPEGVYLITGGLGGLGLTLTRHLAERGARAVALVGRTPLPPRCDWESWLAAHAADDAVSQTLRALERIERGGTDVVIAAADVADFPAMERVWNELLDRYGRVHGVIHAAGIVGDRLLGQQTSDQMQSVLRPKVAGAQVLERLTRTCPLDFCIYCSSAAVWAAGPGQAVYAAANGYLDALAQRAQQRGENTISIGWTALSGVGMAARARVSGWRPPQGWPWLDVELAAYLLDRVLERPRAHWLIGRPAEAGVEPPVLEPNVAESTACEAARSFTAALPSEPPAGASTTLAPLAVASDHRVAIPADSAADAALAAREVLDAEQMLARAEERLRDLVAGALGLSASRVPLDANFMELGLDSILATRVARQLAHSTGIELESTVLFAQANVVALARYLTERDPVACRRWVADRRAAAHRTVTASASASASAPAPAVAPAPAPAEHQQRGRSLGTIADCSAAVVVPRSPDEQAIALIGLAGRFPGAGNIDAFWQLLSEGRDAIGRPDAQRQEWWSHGLSARASFRTACASEDGGFAVPSSGAVDDLARGIAWGGFLEGVDLFDAGLMGISPREARLMDPQQRIFLEIAWETLESAGYRPDQLAAETTGVFVGVSREEYAQILARAGAVGDPHVAAGNALTMVANRVSYTFDWHGPSLAIDTACSSSLVAVHMACESLRRGESTVALAGGVNLLLSSEHSLALAAGGMLSDAGRCRTFDWRADGYVRGEGAAAVLLKPLDVALRDGDRVWAVIRGSRVNHDGHSKAAVTAPNPAAQAALIRGAHLAARVSPRDISYIEAHGTGTALGDPLELEALAEVFGQGGTAMGRCALGSVKSNIGHLEAAAGIAGLIKVALMLDRRQLPPTLHVTQPNSRVRFERTAFHINDRLRPWFAAGPRIAGISSLGAGGTNAHVVVEEAPVDVDGEAHEPAGRSTRPAAGTPVTVTKPAASVEAASVLTLSAADEPALCALLESYRRFVARADVPPLADLCYAANTGRARLRCRVAIVARWLDQLSDRLHLLRDWSGRELLRGSLIFCGVADETNAASAWPERILPRLDRLSAPALETLDRCCTGRWFDRQVRPYLAQRLTRGTHAQFASSEEERTGLLAALAELFVWGAVIDWDQLERTRPRRRPLLPAYPFQRRRYWVEPAGAAACEHSSVSAEQMASAAQFVAGAPAGGAVTAGAHSAPAAAVNIAAINATAASIWLPQWIAQPVSSPAALCASEGAYVVLAGNVERHKAADIAGGSRVAEEAGIAAQLGAALMAQLRAGGCVAIEVLAGRAYDELSPDRFTCRPGEVDDLRRLIGRLEQRGHSVAAIVHLWPVDMPRDLPGDWTSWRASLDGGPMSLIAIAGALAARPGAARSVPRVLTATCGAQSVLGSRDCVTPVAAMTWGVARVASLEVPQITWQAVDLPADDLADHRSVAAAAAAVISELAIDAGESGNTHEAEIAWRGATRYVSRRMPAPLLDRAATGTPLRREGVYLISGGLGALGLRTAAWLVEHWHARVALLARTAFPPRDRWADVLDRADTEPRLRDCLAALAEIESQGGKVLVFQADVADEHAVRRAVSAVRTEWGSIHGVFHLAGSADEPLLRNTTRGALERVWRAKVQGAAVLDTVFANDELDFLALYSSVAGIEGNVGQGGYAAASRFLDSFAAWRSAQGKRTCSIDWGTWADVGLAAAWTPSARARGLEPLVPAVALAALEPALALERPQVIVANWIDRAAAGDAASRREHSLPAAQLQVEVATTDAARNRLRDGLQRLIAATLELPPAEVATDRSILELGVDSILAARLSAAVGKWLGCELPQSLWFDHPTIDRLSRALVEQFGARLADVSSSEPTAVPSGRSADPSHTKQGTFDSPRGPSLSGRSAGRDRSADQRRQAIAVIGMSGRFPGARDLTTFWRRRCAGFDVVRELDGACWRDESIIDAEALATGRRRWAALLDDVDQFDSRFFQISPREALEMDPQQRLLAEVAWETLEAAGCAGGRLIGTRTGVFVGAMPSEYLSRLLAAPAAMTTHVATGNAMSVIANRVSYLLNLRGPCLSIDTACSSSLVAVHEAAESLRRGECELALAAGTQAALAASHFTVLERLKALSPTGRSRAFDQSADGYVLGEGVGAILLKPLDRALADGDPILGLLVGSAINHGGQTAGLTVPSAAAQAEVIRAALDRAGVTADSIGLIQTHGTGTSLGDPIEIEGLVQAFRVPGANRQTCALASIKSSIGHLEAAAGIAGMIEALLALRSATLPPTLHFECPNPRVRFEQTPFFPVDRARPWRAAGHPRRAGVSSFGFGGTNAHVVLEEAPARPVVPPQRDRSGVGDRVLVLSARSREALAALARETAAHLAEHPQLDAASVARTAATGREHFEHRLAVVAAQSASSRATREWVTSLEALADLPPGSTAGLPGGVYHGQRASKQAPRIAVLFSGQGSQYPQMARQLYGSEAVFRNELDRCAAALGGELDRPLLPLLLEPAPREQWTSTQLVQPALAAFQLAMWQLWRSWGLEPAALVGHSLGEYVAACAAGALDRDSMLRLVARRARLMQAMPPGAMAALRCDAESVRPLLAAVSDELEIAAINGPHNTVVAGPTADVERLLEHAAECGVAGQRLAVSHAFHTRAVEPMLAALEREAAAIRHAVPAWPVVSNLTGGFFFGHDDAEAGNAKTTAPRLDPAYWARQARGTVRFAECIKSLASFGCEVFLEVGPAPVLSALARSVLADPHAARAACLPVERIAREAAAPAVSDSMEPLYVASAVPGRDGNQVLADAVAQLYVRGVAFDWISLHGARGLERVALPTYPFERHSYWFEPREDNASRTTTAVETSAANDDARELTRTWLRRLVWHESPRTGSLRPLPQGAWLVLGRGGPFEAAVCRMLVAEGSRSLVVRPGTHFIATQGGPTTIDPARDDQFQHLAEIVRASGVPLRGIVHLWTSDAERWEQRFDERWDAAASHAWQAGSESLIRIVQQLVVGGPRPLELWVATSRSVAVDTDERDLSAASAALAGAARCLDYELDRVSTRVVDLAWSGREWQSAADALCREILTSQSAERSSAVALRGSRRYVPGLLSVEPRDPVAQRLARTAVRSGGVYLISGGRGAVGLAFAEHLARYGAGGVVLLGRTPLPPKDQWPTLYDKLAVSDPLVRCLRSVEQIERRGTRVWNAVGDVADANATRELCAAVQRQWGRVDGVVHSAGILRDALVQHLTVDDMQAVARVKFEGALALLNAVRHTPPAFFVLCSSLSGLVGTAGQAAYAAANAAIDALATAAQARGLPLTSLVMGPWVGDGMARHQWEVSRWANANLRPIEPKMGTRLIAAAAGDATTNWVAWTPRFAASHTARQPSAEHPHDPAGQGLVLVDELCRTTSDGLREHVETGTAPERDVEFDPAVRDEQGQPSADVGRARASTQPRCDEAAAGQGGEAHVDGVAPYSPLDPMNAAALISRLTSELRQLFAELLRHAVEAIDPERPFQEHGLDSILAEEAMRALAERYRLGPLPVGLVYEYPSIRELAAELVARFGARLARADVASDSLDSREDQRGERHRTAEAQPGVQVDSGVRTRPVVTALRTQDVAIVGYACRFPGVDDAAAYWQLLHEGRSAIGPMSASRRALLRGGVELSGDAQRSLEGGFLEGIDRFDPLAFRISPSEARHMDPRQRLFLETAYFAAEHAGRGGDVLRGTSTGVFVGTGAQDYFTGLSLAALGEHSAVGGTAASVASRVAYLLDLHGPCLPVDTACSSSLVALHLGVESLRRGECRWALVGAVHLYLRVAPLAALARTGALAADARCRTFDARAAGFVPAEGVAAVLLRPLADALADGDTIYGVVRGTAVNNDGRTAGLTAPSGKAQRDVIRAAWRDAAIEPASLEYIEAHGTGTERGDPIEIEALAAAFRASTARRQFCRIGSVKTNIGHTDAAAGLAGLIKVLLAFEHGALPPSLHFAVPNTRADFVSSALVVADRESPWPAGGTQRRRAGVSAFGFSGTNAHVVLEEPPPVQALSRDADVAGGRPALLVISAGDAADLRQLAAQYVERLAASEAPALGDVCFTAATGRLHQQVRLAVTARSAAEAAARLAEFARGTTSSARKSSVKNNEHVSSNVAQGVELGHAEQDVAGGVPGDDERDEACGDALSAAGRQWPDDLRAELLRALGEQPLARRLMADWAASPARAAATDVKSTVEGRCLTASAVQGAMEDAVADSAAAGGADALLRSLAKLYVAGIDLPWSPLYASGGLLPRSYKPRRVALPLSVLRRERYWLDDGASVHDGGLSNESQGTRFPAAVDDRPPAVSLPLAALSTNVCADRGTSLLGAPAVDWFYRPTWIAKAADWPATWPSGGRWLLIGDRGRTTTALASALRAAGHDIVLATPGPRFERTGASEYQMDVGNGGDYRRLLEAASSPARPLTGIWHLLSASSIHAPDPANTVERDLQRGVLSLLALAHAIGAQPACIDLELLVVTRGAQAVGGERDCTAPTAAAMWGLARVVSRELSGTHVRMIDLSDEPRADELAALALESLRGPDVEVALRGGQRFVSMLRPWKRLQATGCSALRERGTYLITGGRGGIGGLLAQWLKERHRARVVTIGRGGPLDVEASYRADVTDRAAMRGVLDDVRRRFGRLDGVFHLAGVQRKGRLQSESLATFRADLAAKLDGAWVLHELLKDDPVDLVVHFSSVAGLCGNVLQGAYSAASRFLDSFAAWQTAVGQPALAIDWGLWADVGMGASRQAEELARLRGQQGMPPAAALAALERVLDCGEPHVVVSEPGFLDGLVADESAESAGSAEFAPAEPLRTPLSTSRPAPSSVRPSAPLGRWVGTSSAVEAATLPPGSHASLALPLRQALIERIRTLLADVLGARPEQLDDRRGLLELGVDSLLAVKLVRAIDGALPRRLSPTLPFDHPTIERLANHLAETLSDLEVAAVLGAAPAVDGIETRSDTPPTTAGEMATSSGGNGSTDCNTPEVGVVRLKTGRRVSLVRRSNR